MKVLISLGNSRNVFYHGLNEILNYTWKGERVLLLRYSPSDMIEIYNPIHLSKSCWD